MTERKTDAMISELKEKIGNDTEEYHYVIDKVSLDGDYVKVIINDEETETVFILSAIEYFDLGYRISQRITQEDYEKLRRLHAYSYAYRRCINKIAAHDQSVQEIREFLDKSASIDDADQNRIVDDLIRKGLLDDERLVETQFEYDQLKLHGRRKIAYDLKKRGVDPLLVDREMDLRGIPNSPVNSRAEAVITLVIIRLPLGDHRRSSNRRSFNGLISDNDLGGEFRPEEGPVRCQHLIISHVFSRSLGGKHAHGNIYSRSRNGKGRDRNRIRAHVIAVCEDDGIAFIPLAGTVIIDPPGLGEGLSGVDL